MSLSEARGSAAPPLRVQRAEAVIAALKDCGAHRVVDVGSGPGALLRRLQKDGFFTRILGTDVSARSLEQAANMLNLDELADADKDRIKLLHSSAVYRDERIAGFDAVVLMEVIEHIEPSRLPALEDSIFAGAAPRSVIVTTPNSEFNRLYPALAAGTMRHEDHRFEWTRAEFAGWADAVAARHGYGVEYRPVGDESPSAGPATQMAIFRKAEHERIEDSRGRAGVAGRRLRVGQVKLRGEALRGVRGAFQRHVPRAGRQRPERPVGDPGGLRGVELRCRQAP